MIFFNILSFLILTFSTAVIWPSKKNISLFIGAPNFFLVHLSPLFFYSDFFYSNKNIFYLYTEINTIGALSFLIGVFFSKHLPLIRVIVFERVIEYLPFSYLKVVFQKRIELFLLIGIICMIISYLGMGFVPAFASNPLQAKFFRGPYHDSYIRVAVFFRTGVTLLVLFLPPAIAFFLNSFKIKNFLLIFFSFILLALDLQRGPLGVAVFTGLFMAFAFRSSFKFWLLFIMYFVIYAFGAALWWVLGFAYSGSADFIRGLLAGAPDILDQLHFLTAFISNPEYSYGRTFFGGLIPFGYYWNPSVFSLHILNGTNDISDIVSGGLRLPVFIWGYVAFSWIGVIVISFINGFLLGHVTKFIKINSHDYSLFLVCSLYSGSVLSFFANFYSFNLYSVPALVVLCLLMYSFNFKVKVNTKSDYS